jgi:hypothetical protein
MTQVENLTQMIDFIATKAGDRHLALLGPLETTGALPFFRVGTVNAAGSAAVFRLEVEKAFARSPKAAEIVREDIRQHLAKIFATVTMIRKPRLFDREVRAQFKVTG